ncbi:MAG: hypothetical protein BHW55_01890 [Candidatus Melainabacteria bacterium 35_41]|jgi:hypothetical protein|nr:MAG: hypothetical protein BHW55_01890 [Candidatus Melainabacteria bacterium 35_41]
MEPKDFLFDDNEKNTNKPALQNINQNYKNFAITGYIINFGIPLLDLLLVISFGGYTRGMAPLLHMAIFVPALLITYIFGLFFLIGLLIDLFKKKNIESTVFHNIGILLYFVPVFLFVLINAIYSCPLFKQY